MSDNDLYKNIAEDYAKIIPWHARLNREGPFIESQLKSVNAKKILDSSCGTGHHAEYFCEKGFDVYGVDPSSSMLEEASERVDKSKLHLGYLNDLPTIFSETLFDATLILGNSLVHLIEKDELIAGLNSIKETLKQKGAFIAQVLNYESLLIRRPEALPVLRTTTPRGEIMLLRLYDYTGKNIVFRIIRMERVFEDWTIQDQASTIHPWTRNELVEACIHVGFTSIESYGAYTGESYSAHSSDLILVAKT